MRTKRVLRLGFVIAACVSFLVNAAVVGVALRAYQTGVLPFAAAGDFVLRVPADDRAAFLEGLRDEEARLSAMRRTLQERRADMLRLVTAEDADPVAVRAAMAEVQAATSALQSAVQEILFERLVAERTPEK